MSARSARGGRCGRGGRGLAAAAHEQGLGELARVDAGLPSLVRRGRSEAGQGVARAGIGGDEGAASVLGGHETLLLEPGVDGAHGVDVDVGGTGQLADARESLAGLQQAGGDRGAQLPCQLGPEGDVAVAIDGERSSGVGSGLAHSVARLAQ